MISFIVATIGRDSLDQTLASIETWPGDEVLLVGNIQRPLRSGCMRSLYCPPGNDWGSTERNAAMPHATGRYLAFIDDDDTYAPGHRALMAAAIEQTPDRPVLFRMQYPNGKTLWDEPIVRFGNVGTPMILVPNTPSRLGRWGSYVGGDCAFIETLGWLRHELVWRTDVVALIGADVPSHAMVSQ